MGITAMYMPLLKSTIEMVRPSADTKVRALAVAYPDLLVSRADMVAVFGDAITPHLTSRADSDAVNRWHASGDRFPTLFDTSAFFAGLGVTLDCIDITVARGIERVVNMNEPLPADMVGRYDMVMDFGTVEHCFNIAQAMRNCALALRDGGCTIHTH